MTTTEWPNGAIKTRDELQGLVAQAQDGKPHTIYKVRLGNDRIIRNVLTTKSVMPPNGESVYGCKKATSIMLVLYSLDDTITGNFLFTNYFHAWAYFQRMNNGQVEKS